MSATLNIGSVTMPAGEYIVGDPCYAVPEARWMEWLVAADYDKPNARYLLAELDGLPVLGIGTAHGDGCFVGSDNNRYPVDAGLIGLVPVGLAGVTYRDDLSQRVTFERDFECSYDGGVISLDDIEIDTDPDEYFEDDDE